MSAISIIPPALSMTTREIAELTGKEHSHVYRDAIRMFEKLEYTQEKIDGCHQNWIHPQNKQNYYLLHLSREETECLIAGYSVPLRMKIIKRLRELENKFQLPSTFAEALQLAANQAAQLEAAQPAIEFLERYVTSNGNLGFRQVCKMLKANEREFRSFLQNRRIMYYLGKDWTAYQNHIDAGRFCVSAWVGENNASRTSCKFTPKGVEWASQLWSGK